MRPALAISLGIAILLALPSESRAQEERAGESIGRRIDRGLERLTEEVREAWAKARRQVDELSVQGRVYGRLRWDKALADQPIDIDVEQKADDDESTVILTGRVNDGHQHGRCPVCEDETRNTAEDRKADGFGEDVTRELPPIRAERGANRQFLLPSSCAEHQQACHVRAAYQEHA